MNGDDVATAMVLNANKLLVFVSGYTPHYLETQSGGGLGTSAAAVPDTDYIALAYDAAFNRGGAPWWMWDAFGLPNEEGVRVWNGPGPSSDKSDDRAMDITLEQNLSGAGMRVWLTGRVREPEGTAYDVATISYIVFSAQATEDPDEVMRLNLPDTSEQGVALATTGSDVYVAATIRPGAYGTPLILTFKIIEEDETYTFGWSRLFGQAISDIPAAIIAPTRNDNSVSVFVFGQSYVFETSFDQVGVHYSQDP